MVTQLPPLTTLAPLAAYVMTGRSPVFSFTWSALSLEELCALGCVALLEDSTLFVLLLLETGATLFEEAATVPLLDCATVALLVGDVALLAGLFGVPVCVPLCESLDTISSKPSSVADDDSPVISVEER